jgi:crotonobetainyl-CoA hydratase
MTGPVKTRIVGHVLEVTLDRPKANAVDLATSRIMGEVFRDFRDNPDLRVAILTGAGEKFFCPGWDLKAANDGDAVDGDYGVGGFRRPAGTAPHEQAGDLRGQWHLLWWRARIALSCDIILAAEHATFALPEIRSGTVADAASIKLPKRIPYHIAMEMLFTGRRLDAEEAHRWGFVNQIHKADDLMAETWKMAEIAGLRTAAGLRRHQGSGARGRGRKIPGHHEQGHQAPAEDC